MSLTASYFNSRIPFFDNLPNTARVDTNTHEKVQEWGKARFVALCCFSFFFFSLLYMGYLPNVRSRWLDICQALILHVYWPRLSQGPLTAARLAQLGERRPAEREVVSSNSGRTQGLKMTDRDIQPWFTVYFVHIGHPCHDQLTPVKRSYPLTSITWPYCGLKFSAHRGHVFLWSWPPTKCWVF